MLRWERYQEKMKMAQLPVEMSQSFQNYQFKLHASERVHGWGTASFDMNWL